VHVPRRIEPRAVDSEKCNQCGVCLLIGCPAIQMENGRVYIDTTMCIGNACTICQQICPQQAIGPQSEIEAAEAS